jgi:hypothetical protein
MGWMSPCAMSTSAAIVLMNEIVILSLLTNG